MEARNERERRTWTMISEHDNMVVTVTTVAFD